MEDNSDIESQPLSSLTNSTRKLLSSLLNSTKVLYTTGTIKRHRDWRGLASLINISTELEASIQNYDDKTAKVLDIWIQNHAATVGELLKHLAAIDRFDVCEDIAVSIREQLKQLTPANQVIANNNEEDNPGDDPEVITFQDRPGHRHQYHAFVLYADEDKTFVDELKSRLCPNGFELCTTENLLMGHASQFAPIAKLISERCLRVILVISPDFFKSRANTFFMDYAQAHSINSGQKKIWPIIYRPCSSIPQHMKLYTVIWYNTNGMFNFWDRITDALDVARMPRINAPAISNGHSVSNSNSHSAVNIVELPPSDQSDSNYRNLFLPTPRNQLASSAVSLAPSTASLAHSTRSLQLDTSDNMLCPENKKKNKPKFYKRIAQTFTRKKKSKPKMEMQKCEIKCCEI